MEVGPSKGQALVVDTAYTVEALLPCLSESRIDWFGDTLRRGGRSARGLQRH
jgi:hypothetical protein